VKTDKILVPSAAQAACHTYPLWRLAILPFGERFIMKHPLTNFFVTMKKYFTISRAVSFLKSQENRKD